jgi:hypothetical protein
MFSQLSKTTRGTELLHDFLTVVNVTNRSTGLWDMMVSQRLPWQLKYWNVRYNVLKPVIMTNIGTGLWDTMSSQPWLWQSCWCVRYYVLTQVSTNITSFWNAMLCSLLDVSRHLEKYALPSLSTLSTPSSSENSVYVFQRTGRHIFNKYFERSIFGCHK